MKKANQSAQFEKQKENRWIPEETLTSPAPGYIVLLNLNRKVLVVTDSGVPESYADTVAASALAAEVVRIPEGESSKSFDNYRLLLRRMLALGMGRGDCVAAVGGGVVGDLSGFAAACYMRGIDFYNIPTTVLSQVDSSIGGKTAIDLDGIKNVVGAFYQPRCVLVDPENGALF